MIPYLVWPSLFQQQPAPTRRFGAPVSAISNSFSSGTNFGNIASFSEGCASQKMLLESKIEVFKNVNQDILGTVKNESPSLEEATLILDTGCTPFRQQRWNGHPSISFREGDSPFVHRKNCRTTKSTDHEFFHTVGNVNLFQASEMICPLPNQFSGRRFSKFST